MAAATERIGLIATASTTYSYPWSLARALGTLDHLSRGRAGWNIVTTAPRAAARNHGLDESPDPATRYQRADEYVDAVLRLWDSWEDDAIRLDRGAGRYVDPAKIHPPRVDGRFVTVEGPLTSPRPPQGYPVLVQAGSSNPGRAFAATYAEAIFTAQQQLEDAQRFFTDIKKRTADAGRDPEHVKILPGISPFIGSTETEAKALEREFNELTSVEFGLIQLEDFAGAKADPAGLDEPVPLELFAGAGNVDDNTWSRRQVVAGIVERERPTLRQLLHRLAGARGHRVVVGTPEQVADAMEEWFVQGAADGFNVMPPYLPGGLETFTGTVVPILRERGLFREGYTGHTLREHLGLPRPGNRHVEPPG
ncbi:NtaA/DmoA family FMN-dependent monooxygenase [Pseudonocardia sp. NPDC049154]|uniref:NtaA/DmoA family FMN-dependent monooxygenase n=1 Tax=Pseudonocardia sp. NPDC049154 TaxID=3155501 RepID=UPI003407B8F7